MSNSKEDKKNRVLTERENKFIETVNSIIDSPGEYTGILIKFTRDGSIDLVTPGRMTRRESIRILAMVISGLAGQDTEEEAETWQKERKQEEEISPKETH